MSNDVKTQVWETPDDNILYCVKCGKPVKPSWGFCPKCGTPVQSIEDHYSNHELSPDQAEAIIRKEQEDDLIRERMKKLKNQQQPISPSSVKETDTNYKEHEKKTNAAIRWLKRIPLFIVLFFLCIIVVSYIRVIIQTDPAAIRPTASPILNTTPTPQPVFIANGHQYTKPDFACVCPLTISVPNGDNDYYIYLRYLKSPKKTTVNREYKSKDGTSMSFTPDIDVYIKAGNTVSIKVPIGVYKLSYACGKTWFGKSLRFGTETVYFSSPDNLSFFAEDNGNTRYFSGHTLELWLQSNGNLDRTEISGEQFPA